MCAVHISPGNNAYLLTFKPIPIPGYSGYSVVRVTCSEGLKETHTFTITAQMNVPL